MDEEYCACGLLDVDSDGYGHICRDEEDTDEL
jgi:hypothetical protein